jgi:hypothetical protein
MQKREIYVMDTTEAYFAGPQEDTRMKVRGACGTGIRLCVMAVAGAVWLHAGGPGMPARALAAGAEASVVADAPAAEAARDTGGKPGIFGPGAKEDLHALAGTGVAGGAGARPAKKSSWNIAAAIRQLENARLPSPGTRRCVAHVKAGLAAGGIPLEGGPLSAKDYGPILEADGFQAIGANAPLQAGDVVVIQSAVRRPHGHMAMYNGREWISDFRQGDLYPGPHYRKEQPEYTIYRRE